MNKKTGTSNSWNNPLFVDTDNAARIAEAQCYGNVLRRKVGSGWALGTFVLELPAPTTLYALALAGFDFVVIDMEHSAVDFARLESLVAAGHAAGIPVLVRPRSHDVGLIGKILDLGANGIMVPRIETPEQAHAAVAQSRFPPLGERGFSPITRYDTLRRPLEALNESTYVILQIEGQRALEQARQIAAVPGIDAVFIGPYDLAVSMGVPPGSSKVSAEARKLAKAMPRGVQFGIYVDDPAKCGQWAADGFALQCVSFDGRMLSGAAQSLVAAARKGMKAKKRKR